MFDDRLSIAIENIKYLIFQVTSQNRMIKGPCHFMKGSSSLYVITIPSLAAIGIVVVNVQCV